MLGTLWTQHEATKFSSPPQQLYLSLHLLKNLTSLIRLHSLYCQSHLHRHHHHPNNHHCKSNMVTPSHPCRIKHHYDLGGSPGSWEVPPCQLQLHTHHKISQSGRFCLRLNRSCWICWSGSTPVVYVGNKIQQAPMDSFFVVSHLSTYVSFLKLTLILKTCFLI